MTGGTEWSLRPPFPRLPGRLLAGLLGPLAGRASWRAGPCASSLSVASASAEPGAARRLVLSLAIRAGALQEGKEAVNNDVRTSAVIWDS